MKNKDHTLCHFWDILILLLIDFVTIRYIPYGINVIFRLSWLILTKETN